MCVPEGFVSHGPTPAVWSEDGRFHPPGGPCLSGASWSDLLRLASVRSYETRRGVNGFGSFCRNKRTSPAGAKPGNTENHADENWNLQCDAFSLQRVFTSTPKMDSQYTS